MNRRVRDRWTRRKKERREDRRLGLICIIFCIFRWKWEFCLAALSPKSLTDMTGNRIASHLISSHLTSCRSLAARHFWWHLLDYDHVSYCFDLDVKQLQRKKIISWIIHIDQQVGLSFLKKIKNQEKKKKKRYPMLKGQIITRRTFLKREGPQNVRAGSKGTIRLLFQVWFRRSVKASAVITWLHANGEKRVAGKDLNN